MADYGAATLVTITPITAEVFGVAPGLAFGVAEVVSMVPKGAVAYFIGGTTPVPEPPPPQTTGQTWPRGDYRNVSATPMMAIDSGVGVPEDVALTALTSANNPNGSATFPGDGTYRINGSYTYTGWRFNHRVDVRAGTVSFVNCLFTGDASDTTTMNTALLMNSTGTGVVTATNCTFHPTSPYEGIDGVRGAKLSISACDISHVVDGGQFWGAGSCTITNNWVHDLQHYPTGGPPSNTGPTHNDGFQISSGSNYTITDNLFEGINSNSGIIITQALGATSDLLIDGNIFDLTDNGADINIDDKGTSAVANLTITNNIFNRDLSKYQIFVTPVTFAAPSFVYNPNAWDDGTAPPSRGWALTGSS